MGFTTATLRFLRGLKRHNLRSWFEAHRTDYEREVRDPMRAHRRDGRAAGATLRLPALLEQDFDAMLPLVRWLNGALGLKPATRR